MSEILEARVTSPNRQELLRMPHGLAIVIFNSFGQVLLGLEATSDQYRPAGVWNIVTETWKSNLDFGIKEPLRRALNEELSAPQEWFRYIPGSYRETNGTYVATMGYDYKYRCVCLLFTDDPTIPAETIFHAKDGEILTHHWFPLDELPGTLESGARIVIDEYRKILRI